MGSAKKNAIVIGSGFGGIASAIRLQAMGFNTTLLEKLDKPGGRAYVWEQDGFRFDAGPTVVTAPHCIEELFQTAGKNMADYVELLPVDPMYRIFWQDGTVFDYTGNQQKLLAGIRQLSPKDEQGYLEFQKYATKVFEKGYLELGHVPFLKIRDMLAVAPDLLRLKAHKSVYEIVSQYISNDKLRQAFSFNSLLIGGNPFVASAIYTLIHPLEKKWGVWFPKGGMNALVSGLIRLFEDIGGTVRLATPAAEIVLGNGKIAGVKTADGNILNSDVVVCNNDVVQAYSKLLGQIPAMRRKGKALKGKRHSPSLFLYYFGTDKMFPGISHHNVMFGPRYREHLNELFNGNKLPEDFSLYLHAPTITDPSCSPEGKHAFYVLSPVPNLLKAKLNWEKEKVSYKDKIVDYLEQRYMPGLRNSIVSERIFTPDDFETRLDAFGGSAFSLEPTLTQSAWFRVHNREDAVPGLYFCGAGTHPGAGLPGVIGSAKAACGVIAQDFGETNYFARSESFAEELRHASIGAY